MGFYLSIESEWPPLYICKLTARLCFLKPCFEEEFVMLPCHRMVHFIGQLSVVR